MNKDFLQDRFISDGSVLVYPPIGAITVVKRVGYDFIDKKVIVITHKIDDDNIVTVDDINSYIYLPTGKIETDEEIDYFLDKWNEYPGEKSNFEDVIKGLKK